jgi:hypothetical protein
MELLSPPQLSPKSERAELQQRTPHTKASTEIRIETNPKAAKRVVLAKLWPAKASNRITTPNIPEQEPPREEQTASPRSRRILETLAMDSPVLRIIAWTKLSLFPRFWPATHNSCCSPQQILELLFRFIGLFYGLLIALLNHWTPQYHHVSG